MEFHIRNTVLHLAHGDITKETVDAVVNAANNALAGGGGVDGAIHPAGGPAILAECRRKGGCPTGQTIATTAGKLPNRYVLHTVGPIWRGGISGEPELLASCYRTALITAMELGCDSVAFPSISTGVYGYPTYKAAQIAIAAITEFLHIHAKPKLVRLVLFDTKTFDIYSKQIGFRSQSRRNL